MVPPEGLSSQAKVLWAWARSLYDELDMPQEERCQERSEEDLMDRVRFLNSFRLATVRVLTLIEKREEQKMSAYEDSVATKRIIGAIAAWRCFQYRPHAFVWRGRDYLSQIRRQNPSEWWRKPEAGDALVQKWIWEHQSLSSLEEIEARARTWLDTSFLECGRLRRVVAENDAMQRAIETERSRMQRAGLHLPLLRSSSLARPIEKLASSYLDREDGAANLYASFAQDRQRRRPKSAVAKSTKLRRATENRISSSQEAFATKANAQKVRPRSASVVFRRSGEPLMTKEKSRRKSRYRSSSHSNAHFDIPDKALNQRETGMMFRLDDDDDRAADGNIESRNHSRTMKILEPKSCDQATLPLFNLEEHHFLASQLPNHVFCSYRGWWMWRNVPKLPDCGRATSPLDVVRREARCFHWGLGLPSGVYALRRNGTWLEGDGRPSSGKHSFFAPTFDVDTLRWKGSDVKEESLVWCFRSGQRVALVRDEWPSATIWAAATVIGYSPEESTYALHLDNGAGLRYDPTGRTRCTLRFRIDKSDGFSMPPKTNNGTDAHSRLVGSKSTLSSFGFDVDDARTVVRVDDNTPAAHLGVQHGWVVESIDGKEIECSSAATSSIRDQICLALASSASEEEEAVDVEFACFSHILCSANTIYHAGQHLSVFYISQWYDAILLKLPANRTQIDELVATTGVQVRLRIFFGKHNAAETVTMCLNHTNHSLRFISTCSYTKNLLDWFEEEDADKSQGGSQVDNVAGIAASEVASQESQKYKVTLTTTTPRYLRAPSGSFWSSVDTIDALAAELLSKSGDSNRLGKTVPIRAFLEIDRGESRTILKVLYASLKAKRQRGHHTTHFVPLLVKKRILASLARGGTPSDTSSEGSLLQKYLESTLSRTKPALYRTLMQALFSSRLVVLLEDDSTLSEEVDHDHDVIERLAFEVHRAVVFSSTTTNYSLNFLVSS